MATVVSCAEGLLVVREQHASLPDLTKHGRLGPENVTLMAQMQGESHKAFSARVLGRASRELGRGHSPRAAMVSIEANVVVATLESRQQLLQRLAPILAIRPEGELVILAPADVEADERTGLFELVETTMRAAPMLNVRLAFANPSDLGGRHRRSAMGSWQPVAV